MIQEAIQTLVGGDDLDTSTIAQVMGDIMSGKTTDAQIGAFLIALRLKGETIEEIAGCARVMREKATSIMPKRKDLVDTCGTGGDGSGTFNISTTVAFVVAGAGLGVAKHGNRAMSSNCGSADVLAQLGFNLECSPERVAKSIDEVGIGFLFAPALHGAMKHAIGPRREIGTRTVFNVLGPLTNPAGAPCQLIGVYAPELTEKLAGVLDQLGAERAIIVHGVDGLDELTLTGSSRLTQLTNGKIETSEIHPSEFGMEISESNALKGGDAATNAKILCEILDGSLGPKRDIVLLNAAAALVAGGLSLSIGEGVERAGEAIDDGSARHTLDNFIKMSH
ncbi:MAG: anthranilate phosphoribosyltransferase [Candidatus Latescibacterota bacterium]|nr:anthranilate phosphoribosyltransferase [Candidatus Latescibacterota bacterium]